MSWFGYIYCLLALDLCVGILQDVGSLILHWQLLMNRKFIDTINEFSIVHRGEIPFWKFYCMWNCRVFLVFVLLILISTCKNNVYGENLYWSFNDYLQNSLNSRMINSRKSFYLINFTYKSVHNGCVLCPQAILLSALN